MSPCQILSMKLLVGQIKTALNILTISTEDKSFNKILNIITKYEKVYGTYGIHPHEAKSHKFIKTVDILKKISK